MAICNRCSGIYDRHHGLNYPQCRPCLETIGALGALGEKVKRILAQADVKPVFLDAIESAIEGAKNEIIS